MSSTVAATNAQISVVEPPAESAAAAGLRYVTDRMPGIMRKRAGKGFVYIGPDGSPIRDIAEIKRIRALAIPPAWTSVWICPRSNGHLQATGRDARGRKQYRYHNKWREVRDESEYTRLISFGDALPLIRKRVESDLASPGLPRDKVLGTVVQLLEKALIRIGNAQYARENGSFGLTTLRDKHVNVDGSTIRFQFIGKSGKKHSIDVNDRRLARIVKRCQDIPGYELFRYEDENKTYQAIGSSDVNDYLREITGLEFSAKDFRTWAGTVLTAKALSLLGPVTSERKAKRKINQAVCAVSELLGNTPSVCRKCYIHPEIINAYRDGTLHNMMTGRVPGRRNQYMNADEWATLNLLKRRLNGRAEKKKAA